MATHTALTSTKIVFKWFRRFLIVVLLTLIGMWVLLSIKQARAGDFFFFPKLVAENIWLPAQDRELAKMQDRWQAYFDLARQHQCPQLVLAEQEFLIALQRTPKTEALWRWLSKVPTRLDSNCSVRLPLAELHLVGQLGLQKTARLTGWEVLWQWQSLQSEYQAILAAGREHGFASQRDVNNFAQIMLAIQTELKEPDFTIANLNRLYMERVRLNAAGQLLGLTELQPATLETAVRAACIFAPEYAICANEANFTAKWNSIKELPNRLTGLKKGEELWLELLKHLDLLT